MPEQREQSGILEMLVQELKVRLDRLEVMV
jgi:hypothetical protein